MKQVGPKSKRLYLTIILFVVGFSGCQSPYEATFQPLADNYKAELLYPPRSNVLPGYEFRKDDTLSIRQGCYKGIPVSAKVLDISNQTLTYDNSADFQADWKKILGIKVNWAEVGKIDIKLSNFTQDAITNIGPTFASHCFGGQGYRSDDPIFASLIKIGNVEATFYDKTGKEIKLDVDLSQLKKLVEVTPSVEVKLSNETTTSFNGEDVYVLYYKVEPSVSEIRKSVTCKKNVVCDLDVGNYTLIVKEVKQGSATVDVSNYELDNDEFFNIHELKLGKPSKILERLNRKDIIRLDDTDPINGRIGILVSSTSYGVENGRLFEE